MPVVGVRDPSHRGLVGRAMDEHQGTELVVDALVIAIGRGTPDVERLVHHAGRGSQRASLAFCSAASRQGLQVSFGSTDNCFDNAAAETFLSSIKRDIRWSRGSDRFDNCARADCSCSSGSRCSTTGNGTKPRPTTAPQLSTPLRSVRHHPVSTRGSTNPGALHSWVLAARCPPALLRSFIDEAEKPVTPV